MRQLALPLVFAVGCAMKKEGGAPRGGSGTLEAAKAFADAELKIEHMRKKKESDWAAIETEYARAAPVVRRTDAVRGTGYDGEIREALARCARGEKPKVHQQVLAKGLQHVAALAIAAELERLSGDDRQGRSAAAERVAAYFEGIRPTFARRDRDFFPRKETLTTAADEAVEHLKKAAASGSPELVAARREVEDVLARTYALSVLYEIMKIEELREKDHGACEVKLMEAVIFYRIIGPRVKRHDPRAHETISAMLRGLSAVPGTAKAGGYEAMSSAVIEEQLRRGLPGLQLR